MVLFYQVGEWFQSYAVGKSRRNISELMDIRPDYANIEQDGQLVQVDPDEVPSAPSSWCSRARRCPSTAWCGGGLLHAEYQRPDRRESAPGRQEGRRGRQRLH